MSILDLVQWLAGAVLLVVFTYVLARTAGYAWFRSKLDYMRELFKVTEEKK